jgi:hypothetical protein
LRVSPTKRLSAAASSALRPVLAGPARPARWLGASAAAVYLATGGEPPVLAVLAHDAVRLPCGLLLASTSAEAPLTALAPRREQAGPWCTIGGGAVSWAGPDGPVVVSVVREWAPVRAAAGSVVASALESARAVLPGAAAAGLDDRLLAALTDAAAGAGADGAGLVAAVTGLLGRGPGLTPSGDDVLAGFLVGAHAFGLDVAGLRRAVAELAPFRTTALSAALLWHAGRGECADEVAALAAVLTGRGSTGPAARRLLAVGHTSGAALACGLLLAAERAPGQARCSQVRGGQPSRSQQGHPERAA